MLKFVIVLVVVIAAVEGKHPPGLKPLGCWADKGARAIPPMEGKDKHLDGHYKKRGDPIGKCMHVAKSRGWKVFAVQDGGWCASAPNAHKTFRKYGRSTDCNADGEGGRAANEVYRIKG